MQLYHRIKKYLFLLATFFCIAIGIHSVVLYLYHDAEIAPERGGTFQIGLLGSAPSLNPTQYGLDRNNTFALAFLYRGLLRYNPETRQVEGDLANCDISKSYAEVKCIFKKDSEWSDGSKITIEDVLATYSLLAETKTNKKIGGILSQFAITRDSDTIVFRAAEASSEYLELLTLPIIKKSVAEKFRNSTIRPEDSLYSGLYSLEKQETIPSGTAFFLTQNRKNVKSDHYNRIVLRYYTDTPSLEASKNILNLIIPGQTDISPGARFTKVRLSSPNFIALFQNSERLTGELRRLISGEVFRSIELSTKESGAPMIKNPFFGSGTVFQSAISREEQTKRLESLGFFTKDRLPPGPSTTPVNTPSAPSISTGSLAPKPVITPPSSPQTTLKKLVFFTSPSTTSPKVIAPTDEVVLQGTVPKSVDAVYIGNYRLRTYVKGSGTFTYRARTDIGNLRNGLNSYTLSFETNAVRSTQETLALWVITNPNERAEKIASFDQKVSISPVSTSEISTLSGSIFSGSTVSSGSIATSSGITSVSTGTGTGVNVSSSGWVTNSGVTIPTLPPQKETPSDPKALFTRDGKRAKLVLASIETGENIADQKKSIQNTLADIGFEIETREISPDNESIQNLLKWGSKTYDLLVTGVNLGTIGNYLFPYLHSGQSENGFNFAKVRNPNLDILLEELKNKELSPEALARTRSNIVTILQNEALFLPLGESPEYYYVDPGVRDFGAPTFLASIEYIIQYVRRSYINTSYVVAFEKKSWTGFWDFLQTQLNSPSTWETR